MGLKIENLTKTYGDFKALNHVSLEAENGKILGILGRNGAGKTTTIKSIMGIIEPEEGSITFDGIDIRKAKVSIGYLPEERGLYVNAVVKDQLLYFAMLNGMDKKAAFTEIKKLLDANDFINYNFDLIYGWPKSTKEAFIEDLNFILNLNPKHISIYPLAIEEGTYLHNIHLQPIEDDEYAEIYYEAKKLLKDKGFFRYEVSNFAKIGYESKHNLTYWLGEDYLAAGLGATSFYNGVRATRTRSILKYIDGKYILNENVEDFFEQKNDFIMLNLRLDKGFTFKQYYDKFKSEFLEEK